MSRAGVLLAVALGLDISCRVALAWTLDRGWHRTAAMGVFGAAAAAGKLIGLNAGTDAGCLGDRLQPRRRQSPVHPGRGAHQAPAGRPGGQQRRLSAAMWRSDRLHRGPPHFYWPLRLFRAVPAERVRRLGAPPRPRHAFHGEALGYKPYPCGRPLHAAIDAALNARAQLAIERPDDIASVTVEADPAGHNDQFGRGLSKRCPTQVVEAQFAQPFLIATALVHGKVGIAEVDGLGDASVLALWIGSLASRGMADRKGRSASRSNGPAGAQLPSRPALQLGHQKNRSPMLCSKPSSATARAMRCSRCRMQV